MGYVRGRRGDPLSVDDAGLMRSTQLPNRIRRVLALAAVRSNKMARIAMHPRFWRAVWRGVVPSVEHAHVPFGNPQLIVDVGASHGQFSLFSEVRFPAIPIIAFEPLPAARSHLEAVLSSNVDVRPYAVGSRSGLATLQISGADDSSSLLRIGRRQIEAFPGTGRTGEIEVEVVTLADELKVDIPSPWLLKVDVQGFELEVLRGAVSVFDRVSEIYVECSFVHLYDKQALADEVVSFLLSYGYRLKGVFNVATSCGAPIQADMLFRKEIL